MCQTLFTEKSGGKLFVVPKSSGPLLAVLPLKYVHFFWQGDDCPKPWPKNQTNDTFRPTSCLDYLSRGACICGMYKLYDNAGNSYPAYCDLKSEPGTAWTLVMSWANMHRALPSFRNVPLKGNAPVNENAQNWNLYRLSLTRMRSLQAHSTHWRATCSYPTYGVDFRDYVRGNFKDFNVVDFSGSSMCMKVEYVNILGHMGMHLKARVWQSTSYFWHISDSGCQFDPTSVSVSSEDYFGYYVNINPRFRCNEGPHSTTQWWFGAHL